MTDAVTAPVIIIKPEPGERGFDVVVIPAPEGELLDRGYDNVRAARGYASGLRLIHGWKIHDEAAETERG